MATIRRDLEQSSTVASANRLDVLGLPVPPAWMVDAVCSQVDPDLFFPDKGGTTTQAKKICASCPVAGQCLEYALSYETGEHHTETSYPAGVYGGLTARERRPLRAERRGAA